MKDFYLIDNDYAVINLQTSLYPLVTIQKAIANYLENTYIKLEEKNNEVIIRIKEKENKNNLEKIVGEFYNELLRESLRYNISIETKNIRELIVGRALYTTCIETDENEIEENKIKTNEEESIQYNLDENYSLDEIAIHWFENIEEKHA